ncbi:MAG TPA: hypothetical protein VG963_10925 [Polyangiaceae bacterium]|nr:hypothetical protein [Polyangiaceae bacterium]
MIRHCAAFCLSVAMAVGALAGCSSAGEGESDVGVDQDPLVLNGSSVFYDLNPGHQCVANVNGVNVSMHCCPSGYAMIGARVDQNAFKCAVVNGGLAGTPVADTGTQRNGMHSCPLGDVMVGLRADMNVLLCQKPINQSVITETVDPGTQDGFPMHVCPPGSPSGGLYNGYAMSGIRIDQNKFNCAF